MGSQLSRRGLVQRLLVASAAMFSGSLFGRNVAKFEEEDASRSAIIKQFPLGFQWETQDPFLFCVHHEDQFPEGNAQMGPAREHFKGRHIGDDFIVKDGFRMYHGKTVPGFPGHPHRGFETITVVREGIVDHADSTGAAGRYGNGDVQWMTAGKGVQHSEMFPLISDKEKNPLELFQVWLNLPKKNKMVEPHFKMLWRESIPLLCYDNDKVLVELIAGQWDKNQAVAPPPNSWAADPKNEVLIVNIKMEANSTITLPVSSNQISRSMYFYEGSGLAVNEKSFKSYSGIYLNSTITTTLKTGDSPASILILQGKPIDEQVIQYGPFVMNSKEEIQQAFEDYHRTKFGGWPWPRYDQVHDRSRKRFAQHSDGTTEIKNA